MIHQISFVKMKTGALPKVAAVNVGLVQARHIQALLKERIADGLLPADKSVWSSIADRKYIGPVGRSVE